MVGYYEPIDMAICSMIRDLSGIICDGASSSCVMKVSTSVSSGFKAVLMALSQIRVIDKEGWNCFLIAWKHQSIILVPL
ncbi:MAG: L-serine ammonia-lyase, iron-sulfur-dependent, subunit alpha [Gilliamella sp.]|nr:L-serine ammonia-lyase, iron-sulfur-dependent, subunit alpha [Gilliamella sp.]MCO6546058.1 L-serine ammonia-lyase, iron-sulfur-dependent, subunit alpha [Gilliamella sp.]MCO6548195.1 L-serine ammonia-lyase, iron-sulfur-dependent, subunit alpha [Gilliamella sp.]